MTNGTLPPCRPYGVTAEWAVSYRSLVQHPTYCTTTTYQTEKQKMDLDCHGCLCILLIWSSIGSSEYCLSVLSKLFKRSRDIVITICDRSIGRTNGRKVVRDNGTAWNRIAFADNVGRRGHKNADIITQTVLCHR